MAEQRKKRSMITDTTSKISENPKKKKESQQSDEGKQSKKESDRQRRTLFGLSVLPAYEKQSHNFDHILMEAMNNLRVFSA